MIIRNITMLAIRMLANEMVAENKKSHPRANGASGFVVGSIINDVETELKKWERERK